MAERPYAAGMAKQDLSRHQEKIVRRYYDNLENIQGTKLQELISDLWIEEDAKKQRKLWSKAQVALMKMGVDPNRVAAVVGARDLERLAKLVNEANQGTAMGQGGGGGGGGAPAGETRGGRKAMPGAGDGRTIGEVKAARAAAEGKDSLEPENLKKAMQAFRRKLRTLKLDDESRLGGRYTSAGRASGIRAITPPHDFPAAVWAKLAADGKLRRAGSGMYELVQR